MAIITWSEELSVGVKSTDEQHIVLIEVLNGLQHQDRASGLWIN